MELPDPNDLVSFDRDVGRAALEWRRWTAALARDPRAHADDAPLERWRHVAGQSAYRALEALKPSALDLPLRDALRRWVYALMQARIAQPLDAELAAEETERTAQVTVPQPHLTSWREAWHQVLVSATPTERQAWLAAATERAPEVASLRRRLADRRDEAAQRMGFAAGDPLLAAAEPAGSLTATAESLLARTEDLARDVLGKARRRLELPADPPLATDAIAIGVGRDAPEGWPARLAWPWLDAAFGPFARGLRMEVLALPEAIGASSFARACAAFGAALRVAGASPSLPFALARDPEPIAVHRFAYAFGALPASVTFQKRVLGNSARVADAQAKVLARTALLHARFEAARFLLALDPSPDHFEHLTARLFDAPLPRALAGAWPAPHLDARAHLVGLVTGHGLGVELVERFDSDWFANPRAVRHVRAIASGPAHEETPPELASAIAPLVRAFEGSLG